MNKLLIAALQVNLILGTSCTINALQPALKSRQQPGVARPAITGISHIGLTAQSMNADRHFYGDLLGWTWAPSMESPGGIDVFGHPGQWVDIAPATSPADPPMNHVAFSTTDAEQMRLYLAAHGIAVPTTLTKWKDGSLAFRVHDPEGHVIEFIQIPNIPFTEPTFHGLKNPKSISSRIIHAGFTVHSVEAEDAFYRDLLGFHLYWKGGMKGGTTDWVSMQVPDGTDWIEYMLHVPSNATPTQLGGANHFSLGVVDMDSVVSKLSERGWKPTVRSRKQMGRDGKYQLNLYDPDGTRVEYMEFIPKQQPCCSEFTGIQPRP